MASEGAVLDAQQQRQKVEWFRYSKRVVLRSILCREDKGLGLVGERVVVGGWVKSGPTRGPTEAQDVTCCEALLSRVPFLRSIARIFWGKDGAFVPTPVAGPAISALLVPRLRINDGSCVANLQIVVNSFLSLIGLVMSVGTSILVEGVLEKIPSPGKHVVQLKVEKILHVGIVDIKKYPLAKTKLPLEFVRAYPHLRPRTTVVC